MSDTLTPWQKTVLTVYGAGDYAHLAESTPAEIRAEMPNMGDTLLSFLLIELDPKESCDDARTAMERVDSAIVQLQEVRDALEDLLEDPRRADAGNDASVLLCEDGPVAITLERGDSIEILGHSRTIADAESFLSLSATIDPDDLAAGRYGIDAPLGLGGDGEAIPAAKRLGFKVFWSMGGVYWARSGVPITGNASGEGWNRGGETEDEAALRALASLSPR